VNPSYNDAKALTYFFEVLPYRRTLPINKAYSLFEILSANGFQFYGTCGGEGWCGRCRVKWFSEPPAAKAEDRKYLTPLELKTGWRLACRHTPQAGARIWAGGIPQATSSSYRKGSSNLSDTFNVLPPCSYVNTSHHRLGLALDVGTTTLDIAIVDLDSQCAAHTASLVNPQHVYGADVISRIRFADAHGAEGLSLLQHLIVDSINGFLEFLEKDYKMSRSSFTSIIVVGNPTMLHLLRGCTPHSLGYSPFQPLWMERLTDSAAELGFALPPDTKASFFPLASGFIGADAIAAALAVGLHAALRPTLLVDFGTNGEVMLASDGQIYATATAAGPAFEGVGISYGMPAIPGAIQQVLFNGAPRYRTIGNEQARGLCGSGLIDAVAGFVSNGTVRSDGRIVLPGQAAGNHVLEVAPGITISQQDIRQIQLAIGAIRVAITTLIDVATLLPEEIEYVYLAGGLNNWERRSSRGCPSTLR